MLTVLRRVVRCLVPALAVGLLAAGCSGDDEAAEPKPGFDVPAGIELSAPGTEVALGTSLVVGYPEASAASGTALALKVDSVTPAPRRDLALFSVPAGMRAHYVQVTVGNRGPNAAAFDSGLPLWLHTSGDVLQPASPAPAGFRPCPAPTVPNPMPAGASAQGCLLYFVPSDQQVTSVDFQPGDVTTAVRWKP